MCIASWTACEVSSLYSHHGSALPRLGTLTSITVAHVFIASSKTALEAQLTPLLFDCWARLSHLLLCFLWYELEEPLFFNIGLLLVYSLILGCWSVIPNRAIDCLWCSSTPASTRQYNCKLFSYLYFFLYLLSLLRLIFANRLLDLLRKLHWKQQQANQSLARTLQRVKCLHKTWHIPRNRYWCSKSKHVVL